MYRRRNHKLGSVGPENRAASIGPKNGEVFIPETVEGEIGEAEA